MTIQEFETRIKQILIRFRRTPTCKDWFYIEIKSKYKNKKVKVTIGDKIFYGTGKTYTIAFEETLTAIQILILK